MNQHSEIDILGQLFDVAVTQLVICNYLPSGNDEVGRHRVDIRTH